MTDYCSQGRTRPFNVMHLNNCKTHQSYYTCLSRSATHEGTLILSGIDSSKITSNGNKVLSGNLRQEFRELELLDDISKLKFEGILSPKVNGKIRRDIITQYREWKGENHIPANIHQALQWSKKSPFVLSPCENAKWEMVQNNQNRKLKPLPLPVGHKKVAGYKPILSTKPILPNKTTVLNKNNKAKKAQKIDAYSTLIDFNSTKNPDVMMSVATASTRQLPPTPPSLPSQPSGTIWDAQNWSCSYDALFTIIWNMWTEDHHAIESQDAIMQNINFHTLLEHFKNHEVGYLTLDQARNSVRNKLNAQNAQKFPWGTIGVDMKDLLNAMFKHAPNAPLGQETTHCSECSLHNPSFIAIDSNIFTFSPRYAWRRSDMHNLPPSPTHGNTEQLALLYFKSLRIPTPCSECQRYLVISKTFHIMPTILILHLGMQQMIISQTIVIQLDSGTHTYILKGMMYYGSYHFTSQFVDKNNGVWYHDGASPAHQICEFQGPLQNMNNNAILHVRKRQLLTAIYQLV